MTPDMSQYLGVFLDEGQEQLGLLETNILSLERGDHSPDILQVLFRAAHTLKGSSRAMGFLAIGDLTHEMENVLDDLRNSKLSLSTPIVNALLDCLDALGSLIEMVGATSADTGPTDRDIPALVARLSVLRQGGAADLETPAAASEAPAVTVSAPAVSASFSLTDYVQASLHDAQEAGLTPYHIGVRFAPDCVMKSVRVFMVLSALEPLGSVLASVPDEETLDAEDFDNYFQLLLVSKTPLAQIEAALAQIAELDSVAVTPWGGSPNTPGMSSAFELTEYVRASLHDAQEAGLAPYHISVTLETDCVMKSVRVFMVLSALEPFGSVLASVPDEESLDAEDFDNDFQLLLVSKAPLAEIKAALATISQLETVTVSGWMMEGTAPEPTAPQTATPVPAAAPNVTAPVAEKAVEAAKPAVSAPTAPAPAASAPAAHTQTIRVDVARLDNLLNLVGELVIDRTQIARLVGDIQGRYPQDEQTAHLTEAVHRVARITGELQDQIMKARMLPIDGVFQRMPRMVRDLAQKTAKEVDFVMEGGETELDRSVLEALGDPLIHLLRNSVDHGVESPEARIAAGKPRQGRVVLSARQEENHIVIALTDDGGGINPVKIKAAAVSKGTITQAAADAMSDKDAIALIFASGFSTAAVLSDISGRGVGMDIVKSNLEKLGGRIVVESKVGEGSRFTIHLPLTLAIVRALLVSAGGGTYVLPLASVVEMLRLGKEEGEVPRKTVSGQAVMVLRGRTVPLANLADVLCGDPEATRKDHIPADAYVVVIGFGEKQVGLCVDALVGEQEVVIKSLGTLLGDITGLAGATILGNGQVALIVDVAKAIDGIRDAALAPASPRRRAASVRGDATKEKAGVGA